VFVRSSVASARLKHVDTSVAAGAPGVIAVAAAGQLDLPLRAPGASLIANAERPLLARDVVRFVGEPIVVVVAETMSAAADAAELVDIEYEPLPVIVTLDTASPPTRSSCIRRWRRTSTEPAHIDRTATSWRARMS
jgi:carbon-monoxide dehydrogenase large subunit